MKICLPIPYKPQGGMYTFVWNFRRYMDRHGILYTNNLDDVYDVLFVNSWVVPYETIWQVKRSRPEVCVAQRVDGSARDYGRYDDADEKQARVNLLTDLTIFQSHYSKYSSTQKYRVIHQDGPVIYNPVDIDLFTPNGPRLDLPSGRIRVANASWSTNRKKGTWQIDRLARENPDVDFVLCGRYDEIALQPNIHMLGHLDRQEMAIALRSCDLFLNLSENDPCPNVVLEALASGLPVLYKNSGGVPELVGDCGLSIELSSFRASIEQVLGHQLDLSARARQRAVKHFAPGVVFPQYLTAMESAEPQPLPGRWVILELAVSGYPVLTFSQRRDLRGWVGGLYRRVRHLLSFFDSCCDGS